MQKFLDWLQISDPADRKMQTIQGRCYHLQILCHPFCTFLPPPKARYEKMFMHLFPVKNLPLSLNSHLWAQLRLMWDIDTQVQVLNLHTPCIFHPLHFL